MMMEIEGNFSKEQGGIRKGNGYSDKIFSIKKG